MTHPGLDICYISQNLKHNFLDKKESSLILLTQYNISYQDIQQRAQGKRKKAIPSLERNSKAKFFKKDHVVPSRTGISATYGFNFLT
jgi:hypothetical protein